MRLHFLSAVFAVSALLLGAPTAHAALTYHNGDLFLGFHASGGDGVGQDYLVDIGAASQFTSAASAFPVPGLGNLATQLAALYGSDWATRGDLFWSVSGGNLAADPENTLYATRATTAVGTQPLPWLGNSNSAQGVVLTKFNALAGAYNLGSAAAGSTVGTIQNTADANSYASFQPGGTVTNSGGQSFAAFSPSIETSFANGLTGAVLDLIRIVPVYQQYGQDLGSFTIGADGALTFTPAPTAPTVRFESSTLSVNEDTGAARAFVTLRRGGNLALPFTVAFSTANGTAVAGTDYTAQASVPVSFAAYATQATVEVPIALRPGIQNPANRDFTVSLANATAGATLATPSTATVTIVESETVGGKLNFAVNSYQKSESATADVTLTITVNRGNGQTGAATVQVVPTGGTATAADYTLAASPVTLSWADGDVAPKTFDVTIKKDDFNENTESLVLSLQNPTGAVLGSVASTTVSIFDGTPVVPGTVSFDATSYTKTEGATANALVSLSATRSGGKSNAVTVQVAATGGTATPGTDFTLPSPATFSWAAGEDGPKTVTVTVKPDALPEGDETAIFTLQSATGGLVIGAQNTTTLTISDPADSTNPVLTLTSPAKNAKLSGAKVTLVGKATDDQSVASVKVTLNGGTPLTVSPSAPTAAYDYSIDITPDPGANTVVVQAFDAKGNASNTITQSFTFTLLRPLLSGTYAGLLVPVSDPAKNEGLVSVTVTPAGTFTGKASLGGAVVVLKGTVSSTGQLLFGTAKTPTLALSGKVGTTTTAFGTLALTLDTGAGKVVTGTLKDSASATLANVTAGLALYAKKLTAGTPQILVPTTLLDPATDKGKYTAIFQARDGANNGVQPADFPQGDGYSTLSISPAGIASFVGKLADGSKVSFSSPITLGNKVPFYLALYASQGHIAGNISFTETAQSDAAGTLNWFKPAATKATDKLYPAGWTSGIATDLVASRFVAANKPATAPLSPTPLGPGLPAAASATTANIALTLADGGLSSAITDDASINAASKVTIVTTPANPKSLKASFAAATGILTGSFIHPVTNKAVTFNGIAYQKTNTASGYFLYTPPASQAGATIQSGAVGLQKK